MVKQRINCNMFYMDTFSVSTAPIPVFYTRYKNYFAGDAYAALTFKNVHFDITTHSVALEVVTPERRVTTAINEFQKFIYGAAVCIYRKLKFTGKGYKIKKSKLKKSFKLYFGRSHLQYIFSGGLWFKKLSKYRILLVTNNKKRLNRIVSLVLSARPVNRYTKRGFRCTRQFILKRPGKKSTY